ncbi:hypothetical protein ACQR0Z_17385 [Bradyrhizobium sp. HKCCYLS3077]|uniref:hypothetical protein n=1 Tax=Bradyrhizobium sp. HKCCYLS3077 TaxID=3420761 RepID=UPI003EB758FB
MQYLDFMETKAASLPNVAVRGALTNVLTLHRELMSTVAADVSKIRGNGDLSPAGKVKEARSRLTKDAWKVIKANMAARRLAERIEEKRAAVQLPAIDKSDAAGAVLRGQVRERLAGKTNQELRGIIPTLSTLYLQTILEAPELLDADAETVEAARVQAVELVHPGMTAQLDAERDAVRLLASATAQMAKVFGELGDLPNAKALDVFLNETVQDQRHLAAAVEREITES